MDNQQKKQRKAEIKKKIEAIVEQKDILTANQMLLENEYASLIAKYNPGDKVQVDNKKYLIEEAKFCSYSEVAYSGRKILKDGSLGASVGDIWRIRFGNYEVTKLEDEMEGKNRRGKRHRNDIDNPTKARQNHTGISVR